MKQLTLTAAIGLLLALALSANDYGTREPLTCASTKEPAKGAPSAEQAARYFRCGPTGEGVRIRSLYLMEDVKVEVGKARPFRGGGMSGGVDINMPDVDPSQPVYPIRGSFQQYQCNNPKTSISPEGKNCDQSNIPKASGVCYRTTFGDWTCTLGSDNPAVDLTTHVRKGIAGPR